MVAAVDDPYQKGATRTELTLGRIGQAWATRSKGARFVRALSGFLSSGGSRYTTRTYSYAVLGFWEWLDSAGRGLPTPDELSRQDAVSYDRWLRESGENLIRYRLSSDPTRAMDLAIYDFALSRPGCSVGDIRAHLISLGRFGAAGGLYVDASCDRGLHRYLGALVTNKLLRRLPTIEQLRQMPEYKGLLSSDEVQDIFEYTAEDNYRADGDRVCGNSTRIGVLAALWAYMAAQGENLPGSEEPLIRFNIWSPVLRRVREQSNSRRTERRVAKTPSGDLFARVLSKTYLSSHGEQAMSAAEAALRGEVIPSTKGKFADLRDRALLLVMLQAGGPRATEVQNMRRRDLSGDRKQLTIRGKRNKVRVVPVPPAAADAIARMEGRIASLIERRKVQGRSVTYLQELLMPEAPLLPAIRYWGANRDADASCGLTRAGIAMRLRHLAEAAGIDPSTREFAMFHPHGIRRLFAKQHLASGTPLNILQTLMGHSSPSTTLGYAEEKDVDALRTSAFGADLSLQPVSMAPAEPPVAAAAVFGVVATPDVTKPPPRPSATVLEPFEKPTVVRVVREEPKPTKSRDPKQIPESCKAEPVGAARTLCDVYESSWGEPKDRGLFVGARVAAEREQDDEWMAMASFDRLGEEAGAFGQGKRLPRVYVGKKTGLLWWTGTNGDLVPEMPVASLYQIGEQCGPEKRSGLCQALVGLWSEWNEAEDKGPTAAAALGNWVAEFLETCSQVDAELFARDGKWVEHLAPIDQTAIKGKIAPEERVVFREHDERRIIDWFRTVAWSYRTSVGREESVESAKRARKVIGASFTPPDWYALEDPIAVMPASDRDDLLDLVSVLTRGRLISTTPRWGALSRKGCSDLIAAMISYDQALEDMRSERRRTVYREGADEMRDQELAAKKLMTARIGVATNSLFKSFGASDFDIIKAVEKRIGKRVADVSRKKDVWRFRLEMLRKAFGDGPANDPYVRLATIHANDPPLQESQYKDLLDPSWAAQTIRHPPEMIKRWALEQGTHSECVARRLARHMWELFVTARGERTFGRRDELIDYVTTMAAYRVPCPAVQEIRIRDLMKGQPVTIPIYDRWLRAFGIPRSEQEEPDTEDVFLRNPHSLPREKASRSTPNPLLLLLLLLPFIPP